MSKAFAATLEATARTITVGPRGFSPVIENSINTLRDAFSIPEEEAAKGAIPAEQVRDNIDAFIAHTRSPYLEVDFANATNLDDCVIYSGIKARDGYASRSTRELAFEFITGEAIEDGYELDHACCVPGQCKGGTKCPHRACVNPAHLHAMPKVLNVQLSNNNAGQSVNKPKRVRKIGGVCKHGHEMTEENVREDGTCRNCNSDRQGKYRKTKDSEKFIRDHGQGYDFGDWDIFS